MLKNIHIPNYRRVALMKGTESLISLNLNLPDTFNLVYLASLSVHKSLEPFANLLGEWEGQGVTSFPTITTYPCSENISIGHIGQPSFWYR